MSFTRVNSGGWTASVSQVTAAQLNALDVNMTRAIDGNAGGAYTPSAKIQIQGTAGLEIGGTGTASKLLLASRSVTRILDQAHPHMASAQWSELSNMIWRTTDSTVQASLNIPIHVPHGAVLTAVGVLIDPAAHTVVPENYPQLQLWDYDTAAGTRTQIGGTSTDATSPLASYVLAHWLNITSLSTTINRATHRYFLTFFSEYGPTNAKTLDYLATRVTYTCTEYDED